MLNYGCSLFFIIKKMPTESKLKKHLRNFLNYLTTWDQYGVPVGLTLNGESNFKTIYGAIASIGLGIYMIRVMMFVLMPVYYRDVD